MSDPLTPADDVRGTAAPRSGDADGRPPIVELVGVAGVGKSSVLATLRQSDPTLRAGLRIPKVMHLPSVFSLLATFAAFHVPFHGLLWPEMKRALYLTSYEWFLFRTACPPWRGVVLDEGPVYMLARILVFGGERTRQPGFRRWWDAAIARWAQHLDGIVWLDASDATLIRRIRERSQTHRLQRASDIEVAKFLAAYRTSFQRVIAELRAAGGPEPVRLDTANESIARIADRVQIQLAAQSVTG